MRENDNDMFTMQYGRVGGTHSTATYPLAHWDKKICEKVAKGYVDQAHLLPNQARLIISTIRLPVTSKNATMNTELKQLTPSLVRMAATTLILAEAEPHR